MAGPLRHALPPQEMLFPADLSLHRLIKEAAIKFGK